MVITDKVYVLHTRPYRESSVLIDLFAHECGLFRAVFRRNKKAHPVVMFREFEAVWSGRGELKTLRSLDLAGCGSEAGTELKGEKLFSAMYANELLVRLLHREDPHPFLYQAYQQLLLLLEDHMLHVEPLLRQFEFRLLEELGYGYQFDMDVETGDEVKTGSHYWFEPEQGFRLYFQQDAQSNVLSKSAPNRVSGEHLLAIAAEQYHNPEVRLAAKKITRLALGQLLGDKPLKSRELFRTKKRIK